LKKELELSEVQREVLESLSMELEVSSAKLSDFLLYLGRENEVEGTFDLSRDFEALVDEGGERIASLSRAQKKAMQKRVMDNNIARNKLDDFATYLHDEYDVDPAEWRLLREGKFVMIEQEPSLWEVPPLPEAEVEPEAPAAAKKPAKKKPTKKS